VVGWFFDTLKYEHLCRAATGDGKALAVDVNLVGRACGIVRPRRVLDERAPRAACLAVGHCG
jgi:hypothetical protein